ncbi:hypothetical protein CKF54_06825 [Psittacicella hinzii]|uniref:Uncharacterized protein n=1 Tax=Psittacicella hinzii TaxID=2028575 RepID=A0A3A1Y231_9GAMM|nr:hypothetical protein [Psittacicella hinzii]RIY31346.1 hypothetical protein CKF54_06825 [Psittacicella hinzii]
MNKYLKLFLTSLFAFTLVSPQLALANSYPSVVEIAQAGGNVVNSQMLSVNGNVLVAKLYQNNTVVITSRTSQVIAQKVNIGNYVVYASAEVTRANMEALVNKFK